MKTAGSPSPARVIRALPASGHLAPPGLPLMRRGPGAFPLNRPRSSNQLRPRNLRRGPPNQPSLRTAVLAEPSAIARPERTKGRPCPGPFLWRSRPNAVFWIQIRSLRCKPARNAPRTGPSPPGVGPRPEIARPRVPRRPLSHSRTRPSPPRLGPLARPGKTCAALPTPRLPTRPFVDPIPEGHRNRGGGGPLAPPPP